MKIKKLLPIALVAMLLVPAAYAAEERTVGSSDTAQQSQTSNYKITLPEYLDIQKTEVKTEVGATFDNNYSVINLDGVLQTTFTIYNNNPKQHIYLKGTCPLGGSGTAPAIGGTGSAPVLAFSNAAGVLPPTAEHVGDAIAGTSTAASNPNVIAFAVTASTTGDTTTGAPATVTPGTLAAGIIPYDIKNGKYTFDYQLAQTAKADTFSLHDEMGTYTSTITLSNVSE